MKLSFVILNYNRVNEVLYTLAETYKVLMNITDFEIIVIDNASVDNSVKSIKSLYPNVILIERRINNGIAGWNDGFKIAKGEYLIVLDDDSSIENGLESAIDFLDKNSEIGVLALNVMGGNFTTDKLIDKSSGIEFIGCGAIIRSKLYQRIGGFAEWLFIYTHEWEYAIRCLEAGFTVVYFEHCLVKHRVSKINRSQKRLLTYSVRNEMAIVYKYFSFKKRNLFLLRVFLNHLKGVYKHGLKSIYWYFLALFEFRKLKPTLNTSPVSENVQKFYCTMCWSTRPFLGII